METAAEEQGHLVPTIELARQDATFGINRDDEFDFEIGGDDDLVSTGEPDDANGYLAHQTDDNDARQDDPYTHQAQEQAVRAIIVDSHNPDSHGQGHEEVDLDGSAINTVDEADASIEATQGDAQAANNNIDQETNEGYVGQDSGSHGQIFDEQPTGESETFDHAAQTEIGLDHDFANAATSVDKYGQEEDGQQDFAQTQVDENEAEVDTNALQEVLEKTAEFTETSGEYQKEEDNDAQEATAAANAQADSIGVVTISASFPNDEHPIEAVNESMDQSSWDAEEDEDLPSKAHPNVTVSYQGQDYFLCAEDPDEDPNTYFLDGVDSIHQPLSQFLENVREVISSEIEKGHEIFIKIDGLGLEFGESTTREFLDQTTLARIIEVNNKLVEQDGGSRSPELYMYLCVRSNPLHRFHQLAQGADEGQGLSNFEKYYDEASADASASHEDDQFGLARDVHSDDLAFIEAGGETEEAGGSIEASDVLESHNPFGMYEDQQPSLDDASVYGVVATKSDEEIELELSAAANEMEAQASFDVGSNTQFATGGEHNNTELDAAGVQNLDFDDTQGDGLSVPDQKEGIPESWVDGQNGQGLRGVGQDEESRQETELLVDLSKKDLEGAEGENYISLRRCDCVGPGPCLCDDCYKLCFSDVEGGSYVAFPEERDNLMADFQPDNAAANLQAQDFTANTAYDEDYLDLGDEGDDNDDEQPADHATAMDDGAGGASDPSRQLSDNSSMTATLDGEDNGHVDVAAVNQTSADQAPTHEVDTSQPQVDEIDWNHEEDETGGVAQSPADLSPSSASAKRSRDRDEDAIGEGDESGTFAGSLPRTRAQLTSTQAPSAVVLKFS